MRGVQNRSLDECFSIGNSSEYMLVASNGVACWLEDDIVIIYLDLVHEVTCRKRG